MFLGVNQVGEQTSSDKLLSIIPEESRSLLEKGNIAPREDSSSIKEVLNETKSQPNLRKNVEFWKNTRLFRQILCHFLKKTEFKFVIFDGTIKVLYILYLYKFVNLSQNSKENCSLYLRQNVRGKSTWLKKYNFKIKS